jgi:hypothetical protein
MKTIPHAYLNEIIFSIRGDHFSYQTINKIVKHSDLVCFSYKSLRH